MLPHLSFVLHFFLTCLLPYLPFPLRIDPLHFQAGCRIWRLNLAFVFFVFILCCGVFLLIGECVLCCVRFSFSRTKPRDWLGEYICEMTYFVSSAT